MACAHHSCDAPSLCQAEVRRLAAQIVWGATRIAETRVAVIRTLGAEELLDLLRKEHGSAPLEHACPYP